MDNRDFSNIGEQIRRTVEDAMNSANYQQLNQKINQTVDMAMNEARRQFQNYQYGNRAPHVKTPVPPYSETYQAHQEYQTHQTHVKPAVKKQLPGIRAKGGVSGMVMMIFGGITSAAILPFTVMSLVASLSETLAEGKMISVALFVLFLVIQAVSVLILSIGIKGWSRYLSFKKYVKILDGREFCSVKELADKTHKTEKLVCKKLKAMIRKGMFVDGFIDQQGTCLIVTKEAYYQFQQAQESRRLREAEEARKQQEQKAQQAEPQSAVDEMIAKGNEYIQSIREANDAIPGEVISAKLDRLELIVRKIFESVKQHPEQMDEMDKFMEYYLPTTQKLVNAYKEFDALPVKGENVTNSMNEIENTLDTISHAFEQLLDDLFQDAAFDISSDISVLQTMLAREGYKEKDFK